MGTGRGQGVVLLIPILLDTDLGSDVDDELALALLWGSPEADLVGVCTTYGDVGVRARIVAAMAALAHRPVTIAPGQSATLSGREIWWAGHEGDAYGELPPGPPDPSTWAKPSPGALLLSNHAAGAHILAISPLASVATAIALGLDGIAGITIMGGEWSDPTVGEHNLASDSVAARQVLTSALPITVIGLEGTRQVHFEEPEIARFAACGPLGSIIAGEMRSWMARWDEPFEVPHDPLTALALLEPHLFEFAAPCAVSVSDGSDGPEGAVRRLDQRGTVRVATAVDVPAARTSTADRIARGLGEDRA